MGRSVPLSKGVRRQLGLRPDRPRPFERLWWRRRLRREGPPLILIGYWRIDAREAEMFGLSEQEASLWPHPGDLVDPTWDSAVRRTVVEYLRAGSYAVGYLGDSTCRLCAQVNGSQELTDRVYLWPEGLVHYVEDHAVRLPWTFVNHVLSADTSWRDEAARREEQRSTLMSLWNALSPEQQDDPTKWPRGLAASTLSEIVEGRQVLRRGVDISWWATAKGRWGA